MEVDSKGSALISNKLPSLAYFLLIVLGVVWGTSFIMIKRAITVYTPLEVGCMRIIVGMIVMMPLFFRSVIKVERWHYKYLLLSGLTGSFLPSVLFCMAGRYINSGIIGALNSLTNLFTFVIGVSFFKDNATKSKVIGVVIGLFGALLLSFGKANTGLSLNIFSLLVVAATVFYAINLNLIKRYLYALDSLTVASVSLVFAGVPAAILLCSITDIAALPLDFSGTPLLSILVLGAVNTAASLILFNRLIQISTPVFASTTTFIIPIVAQVIGMIDGELVLAVHILGIGFIAVALYFIRK